MEELLRTLFKDDAAVSAASGGRVDWGRRPQGDPLPAVRLRMISGPRPTSTDRGSNLAFSRVQADCYGETFLQARDLARAVMAFNGRSYRDRTPAISGIFVDGVRDLEPGDGPKPVFCRSVDLRVTHRDT